MRSGYKNLAVFRSVMVLITGKFLSQIIIIVATPILTRLYAPEDFAVLALFIALTQVGCLISTGRYELAIIIPKKHEEAFDVAFLASFFSLVFSVSLLVVVIVAHEEIADFFKVPELASWLFLLPLTVFFGAIFAIAQSFGIRIKAYSSIAIANVYKSLAMVFTQFVAGFIYIGAGGLVIGRAVSDLFANRHLVNVVLKSSSVRPKFSFSRVNLAAKRYMQFPTYSLPSGILNVVNSNLLNFALPIIFSTTVLGYYALAMRVLGAPLTQVAGPIGQIYMREAAEEIRSTGSARKSFTKALLILFLLALTVFGFLYLSIEWLFAVLFGSKWVAAGEYAKLLLPLFFSRMIVSPLSNTASITDNRAALGINVVLFSVSVGTLYFSYSWGWDAKTTLEILAYSLSFCYFSYLPVLYWLATVRSRGIIFE